MPRSRNIKPGFFSNENLVELDFATRLLFIGMWTEADREGRMEDRPKRLKMALFPADDVDIESMLCGLERQGFIARYQVGECRAIQIVNWSKHQNPHMKETHSVIPAQPSSTGDSGEEDASTMQAPDKHSSIPADSLNLIPDSLNLIPSTASQAPGADSADMFDRFWKLYPNKKSKAKAYLAWKKLKLTDDLFNQILSGLAKYCASPDWTKDGGQFIPHPATWLNGKRWEDEVKPAGNVHQFPQKSRHTGFEERDYTAGLIEREDGSYAF